MIAQPQHDCTHVETRATGASVIGRDAAIGEIGVYRANHAEVDLANKASKEAESMVQKMEEILNEYQAKHGSPENQEIASADAASRGSRPYPTDNPDENWMVYYDEFYQQEYYHEKNSNRTQWEPPSTTSTATAAAGHARGDSSFSSGNSPSAASVAELFSHTEVMPEMSSGSYENRIAKYRRKRRRARRRKLVLVALLCVAAAAGYLALQHRGGFGVVVREEGPLAALQKQINRWLGKEDKALLLRLEQEEKERQERVRREEEEQAAARKRAEEERAEAERQRMLHRPWFCNIPFSYLVHGRCRRLANDNPIFDLQSLVTMMLQ